MWTGIIFTICFFLFVVLYCKSMVNIEDDLDRMRENKEIKPYTSNDEYEYGHNVNHKPIEDDYYL
jgi:hypothetical protein